MNVFEKSSLFFCIGGILILLFLIVFTKHGILDYRKLAQKEDRISLQIKAVEAKNSLLKTEINKLKTDVKYIKHVAKHEYEMAEENEIIFKDEPESKGKTP